MNQIEATERRLKLRSIGNVRGDHGIHVEIEPIFALRGFVYPMQIFGDEFARFGAVRISGNRNDRWQGKTFWHFCISRDEPGCINTDGIASYCGSCVAILGCGFNRSMQHTSNCVSRRSVADDPKITDQLYGRPEGFDVGALAERRVSPPDRPTV